MKRIVVFLLLCCCVSWVWAQETKVVRPVRVGKSKPMREIAQNFKPGSLHKTSAGDYEVPNRPPVALSPPGDGKVDPVWQRRPGESVAAPLVVIEGLSSDDNAAAFGFRVMPPDVNGDVGLNHVVETVNLLFRVWNKSGTPLIPATPVNELWSGFGGNCELNNDGDPVVFYDHLNDRWVISQFVFSVSQCIACSETGDPLGAYNLYEYSTPGNDYPKMSVMPGGTYYGTIRNFNAAFAMDAHAWNGAKIRAGDPSAEMIVRTMTGVSGIDGVQPADLDGPEGSGSPGIFVGHDDANNRLYKYEMVPNFSSPGSTTFTGPAFISVPAYSSAFSGGFFGTAISQPGTTQKLDVLAPFVKFTTHYRDFGTHQALIVDHSVDIDDVPDHAGVRWYELRKVGAGAYTLFQSGTYGPDSHSRWMANAAMNGQGDIGLGYSISSSTVSPSVRYTGRTASDPAGTMSLAEGTIVAGTGSQLGGSRWGDYSRMTVDPADDETFWYFGEYVQATGSFEWNTKIGSFQVGPATPTPPTITSTPNTSAVVGLAYSYDADNTVNVTGTAPITFTFTGPLGFNVNPSSGVVSWTPTSTGSFPVSITATNAQGFDTQNFTIIVGTYAARINAGGANFTDGGGNLYVADQAYTAGSFGFVGGTANTFTNPIGGTTDDALYQALRRTSTTTSFSYRFDVPNGNYAVTLHLMAPATGTGSFIMDVSAEGTLIFNDLNVNTEAGGTFQALIKTFNVAVSNGTLDLDFVRVNKQALVSGIAVIQQIGTPAPEINVTPVAVNFGNVTVGQNANQTVTINNLGTANLTVSSLNITNSVFSLVTPPAVPFNVTPGGSQALTVRFTPTGTGAQTGNLAIGSNDADEPTVNVALSGTGVTSVFTARINSGGPNFTTGGGNLFVADQAYNPPGVPFGFVGGVTGTNASAIANTTDDALYQAFRRSATTAGANFQYNFNVPSGTYSVTLHMAAPNGGGAGNFVMTVQAEGVNVPTLTNFDINAQAGGTNTALIRSFSQVVTDGTLNLNFIRVNKSSLVCGIEVVQTAAPSLTKNESANGQSVPAEFQLAQNYPNPFNPATRISFGLPRDMSVTLTVYNLKGEVIRTLVEGYRPAGNYQVEWNAQNNQGARVASGIYIYQLKGAGILETRRMVLLQ